MKYSIFVFAYVSVVFGAVGAANADLFPEGLRFEIGAAYGYISPDDINNMLEDINEVFQETPYDKIENMQGVNIAIRQSVSSYIGVVAGIGYLYGSTNTQPVTLRTIYDLQGYEVDHDYRLSTIPVSLGPELWYEMGRFNFRACVAGVIHFIQYEENFGENQDAGYSGETITYSGTSLGADITLSAEWNPISILFVGSRIGYGITGNTELTYEGDIPATKNADLSGYHISIYLAFAPWR